MSNGVACDLSIFGVLNISDMEELVDTLNDNGCEFEVTMEQVKLAASRRYDNGFTVSWVEITDGTIGEIPEVVVLLNHLKLSYAWYWRGDGCSLESGIFLKVQDGEYFGYCHGTRRFSCVDGEFVLRLSELSKVEVNEPDTFSVWCAYQDLREWDDWYRKTAKLELRIM